MSETQTSACWPPCVLKLAKAISVAEGFGLPDKIPTLCNNPGDLGLSDAGSFRTDGTMGEGIAKFVNLDDGWQALYMKCNRMLSGKSTVYPLTMTLERVGIRYSGGDPNWAMNVAAFLGVPVTTTLQELAES